jgi:hypothetical protein
VIVNTSVDDNGDLTILCCACGDETAHVNCASRNWWRTGNVMRWIPPEEDSDVELPPWSWLCPEPDRTVTHG